MAKTMRLERQIRTRRSVIEAAYNQLRQSTQNGNDIFFYAGLSGIKEIMISLTSDEAAALEALGQRLKRRRILAGEPQVRAAARLGVSVPTYRKLEQADPSAQIGAWVRALRLYGSLDDLALMLPESLFEEESRRQRAPRRRS